MSAATAEKQTSRSVKVLTRLVALEWQGHEHDCRARFVAVGALLHELRPQVEKWQRYVEKNFPFSYRSALRYEKFFVAGNGVRARTPGRLSDVDPPRPAHHQSPVHQDVRERLEQARAWRARIDAHQKQQAGREQERKDEIAAANRIIETGYRVESKAVHPDHAGGSNYAFRVLTAGRDRLRRGLRFAAAL
jgi:hypothetical protein